MPLIFDDGDEEYLDWVRSFLPGFVINTTRSSNPSYMVLHKKGCPSITNYTDMAQPGGFTERDFIKICALNKSDLRRWVKENGRPDGSFSGECPICSP